MSKSIVNILRFIVLLIIQVTILNRLDFGGFINPQVYILYVILFPYYNKHKGFLLLSSFFLGISIDFFMDSGGMNAFSLTLIAYFRQSIFNFIMGKIDSSSVSLRELPFIKTVNYILVLTIIHNTSLFWLENFSFDELGIMFYRIGLSSLYTLVIILITLILVSKEK